MNESGSFTLQRNTPKLFDSLSEKTFRPRNHIVFVRVKLSFLRLLCWLTRTFHSFRGRWRLMEWLKYRDGLLAKIGLSKVKTQWGHHILIDPYEFVGRYIYIEGEYESDCANLFTFILHSGDCVLDIGAHAGYFTLLASKLVGPRGLIHAFEASAEIMPLLRNNIEINSLENVVVHKRVVSDENGYVDFYVATDHNLGLSSIRPIQGCHVIKTKVPCVTVDSMVAEFPLVRLVKIDVEGAEFMVLNGMCKLIQRDKPYIILELTNAFLQQIGASADVVCSFLNEMGYSLYRIGGIGVQKLSISPTDQCNVLAVHDNMSFPRGIDLLIA